MCDNAFHATHTQNIIPVYLFLIKIFQLVFQLCWCIPHIDRIMCMYKRGNCLRRYDYCCDQCPMNWTDLVLMYIHLPIGCMQFLIQYTHNTYQSLGCVLCVCVFEWQTDRMECSMNSARIHYTNGLWHLICLYAWNTWCSKPPSYTPTRSTWIKTQEANNSKEAKRKLTHNALFAPPPVSPHLYFSKDRENMSQALCATIHIALRS